MKKKALYFICLILASELSLAENCPKQLDFKVSAPQLQDLSRQNELNQFTNMVNSKSLVFVGQNDKSGCMYETSDKSVFVDFGKGELRLYPSDMYLKKGPEHDFESVDTLFFDFTLNMIPSLKVSGAGVYNRSIMANSSDGGRTADILMEDKVADVLRYEIKMSTTGSKPIILKK